MAPQSSPSSSSWAATLGLEPGYVLAHRYELSGLIGEGGFGAVYRAIDRVNSCSVALKLIKPQSFASQGTLARFDREARLAAQLEHPNTVRLLDYGSTKEGMPYIACELLHGHDLEHRLDEAGPIKEQHTVAIAAQVLASLSEAHRKGIVHRDIKPANIFLCQDMPQRDTVKVVDFGLAKPFGPSAADLTQLTEAGKVLGTPIYMAPEQCRGEEIGAATDLYAVGLVVVEMLTGMPLVDEGGLAACMAQAKREDLPLPQAVLACPLGPWVRKATHKDRTRRYGHAEQMLADLRQLPYDVPSLTSTPHAQAPVAAAQSASAQPQPASLQPSEQAPATSADQRAWATASTEAQQAPDTPADQRAWATASTEAQQVPDTPADQRAWATASTEAQQVSTPSSLVMPSITPRTAPPAPRRLSLILGLCLGLFALASVLAIAFVVLPGEEPDNDTLPQEPSAATPTMDQSPPSDLTPEMVVQRLEHHGWIITANDKVPTGDATHWWRSFVVSGSGSTLALMVCNSKTESFARVIAESNEMHSFVRRSGHVVAVASGDPSGTQERALANAVFDGGADRPTKGPTYPPRPPTPRPPAPRKTTGLDRLDCAKLEHVTRQFGFGLIRPCISRADGKILFARNDHSTITIFLTQQTGSTLRSATHLYEKNAAVAYDDRHTLAVFPHEGHPDTWGLLDALLAEEP